MRNNFFDNIYDFIARKWRHIFAIVGFSAAGAAILLTFIGGVTRVPEEFLYYFISFLFKGALLAGIVLGYFRRNRRLLFGSFIAFFTILFADTCVSSFNGISFLDNARGAYIAYWVLQLVYGIVVGAYLVFMVLVYLFNFRRFLKILHYIYLGIFPIGLITWILGIVAVANNSAVWTEAVVPLLECAAFFFFPAVLALGDSRDEEPRRSPSKKAPKEVVEEEPIEPEVEEEPKE